MNSTLASTLDIESPKELASYLVASGRVKLSEQLTIRALSGGVSNRTVLVCRGNGERWVLKQALSQLRVAEEWFSSPLRIHREALGMRWLAKLTPQDTVPRLLFEDHQHHLLAMEAVPDPCDNWKSLLLAGVVDLDLVRQFGELLGTLHGRSSHLRDELSELFADTQFFESLRLEPYYLYTGGRLSESADFYRRLIQETRFHRHSIVHGDYSPKNILVHQHRLILIDHEVIHFGDPGFDLGFSLTHLLSKCHHLPLHRQAFAKSALGFWRAYQSTVGSADWLEDLQPRAVQHTLGCLLARARGRSPLEYLSETERERQANFVVQLMHSPPRTVSALTDAWVDYCDSTSE